MRRKSKEPTGTAVAREGGAGKPGDDTLMVGNISTLAALPVV